MFETMKNITVYISPSTKHIRSASSQHCVSAHAVHNPALTVGELPTITQAEKNSLIKPYDVKSRQKQKLWLLYTFKMTINYIYLEMRTYSY